MIPATTNCSPTLSPHHPIQILMDLRLPKALLQREGTNLASLLNRTYPGLRIIKPLGTGSFGTVKLITYEKQGQVVQRALKLTDWDRAHTSAEKAYRMTAERFGGEWLSLLKYDSENVIETFEAIAYDEQESKFVLINAQEFRKVYQNPSLLRGKSYLLLGTMMEYIENSAELLLPIQQNRIASGRAIIYIVKKILLGVEALHAQGVMMRDLKPENVLVTTEGIIKLIDFTFAKVFRKPNQRYTRYHKRAHSNPGSLNYVPTDRIGKAVVYNEKTDIYSVAAIFFTMLFRASTSNGYASPFDYHAMCLKEQKGLGDHPYLNLYKTSNPPLVDFISKLGHIDPDKRPRAEEALRHPLLECSS